MIDVQGKYEYESYDAGYRDGWHDIHVSLRVRRKRRQRRSEAMPETSEAKGEYALGYRHGRVDGAVHPGCPEWDTVHRVGGAVPLPECPWNPITAGQSPGWKPLADYFMDGKWPIKMRDLLPAREALAAFLPSGGFGSQNARDMQNGHMPSSKEEN
jgi:hypothetical protein